MLNGGIAREMTISRGLGYLKADLGGTSLWTLLSRTAAILATRRPLVNPELCVGHSVSPGIF